MLHFNIFLFGIFFTQKYQNLYSEIMENIIIYTIKIFLYFIKYCHITVIFQFKPLEQLMGVFPAGSKQHVPPTWQELMTDPVSANIFILYTLKILYIHF